MASIEQRIAALENKLGDTKYKVIFRAGDESEDEAKTRAGLADWRGVVIFCNELDERL